MKNPHGYTKFPHGCRWVLVGEKLYITGGKDEYKQYCNCIIYDKKIDKIKRIMDMNKPRAYHTMVFNEAFETLMVIGGENNNSVEIFDPLTNRWQQLPDLNIPRAIPLFYFDEGRGNMYALFGVEGNFLKPLYTDSIEVLDLTEIKQGWMKINYNNKSRIDLKVFLNLYPLNDFLMLIYGGLENREMKRNACIYNLVKAEMTKIDNNLMEELRQEEQNAEERKSKKPKGIKRTIVGIVVIVLIIFAAGYLINEMQYESTDDAYVETTTVNVSPKISGQIEEVYVTDNQFVKEGDLVAVIDSADYKVKLEQADANYERLKLDQANAKANLTASESNIDLAKKDLERYRNLYEQGAVSKQTLDAAQVKYDSAVAGLTQAKQALFSDNGTTVADANLKNSKAAKDKAALDLSYTKVYAPQSGTVSSRRVEKGMWVTAGSPLFTLIPEEVWIVANFKENQLRYMHPGQKVAIKIDTYPNKVFEGKIDSIQRASGAKSSLFPPENAVGSFVKIVQRIPVKIVFTEDIDTEKYNIVPGMSVVPKVKVK